MTPHRERILFLVVGSIIAVMGACLCAGGLWLISLGGTPYYAACGMGLLATAILLIRRDPAALWLYSFVIIATLTWSLWEAGLEWWPLAARGDVIVLIGILLLAPALVRGLNRHDKGAAANSSGFISGLLSRPGAIALGASVGVALVTAVASLLNAPPASAPVSSAQLLANQSSAASEQPAGDWRAYGRTNAGQRYSPLSQITPKNVNNLQKVWTFHTDDMPGQPGDPPETTFEWVIALDATTGKELWRYDPKILDELALQHLTCRGVSYFDGQLHERRSEQGLAGRPEGGERQGQPSSMLGLPVAADDAKRLSDCSAKLFMPTADGRVIALDPESGAVCRNFGGGSGQINLWANMPNRRAGAYYSTSPVAVAGDLIIVGGTVLDNVSTTEQSGVIRAFDIMSGRLVWNWDSGRPDATAPLPPGQNYVANSPNSWSIMSVDETLGMVYVPLGNQPPDQWGGNRSKSVERFSSSVVALDLKSGQLRWVFQTVHHDLWDYDVPSQPTLVDLTIGGQNVPALIQPTKQGELFVLNRRTGEPLLPVKEHPVPQGASQGDHTAPTQPVSAISFEPAKLTGSSMWGATMFDQLACRLQFHRLRYEGRFTPPSVQGSLIHPGNFGVFNWGGIAVDPQRQIAFTTPASLAFVSRLVPRANDTTRYVQTDKDLGSLPALNENFGAPFAVKLSAFTSVLGLPCQAPPWGYVAGVDLPTGKIAWQHKIGTVRDLTPIIPLPFKMGVPSLGGPIMTAGGVAFLSGTLDYFLRAYDVRSGDQIWESRLPAGGQATPMTYLGEDGRQFVLVVAGGHGSLGTKRGDAVIAYALPKGSL